MSDAGERDTAPRPCAKPGTAVRLEVLDHGTWQGLQADLRAALDHRALGQLATPVGLILHDVLDAVLLRMHRDVFRQVMEADSGLFLDSADQPFEALFRSELNEHGTRNIAHACRAAGRHVAVSFPPPARTRPDTLARVVCPFSADRLQFASGQLADALGIRLEVESDAGATRIALKNVAPPHEPAAAPELLAPEAWLSSVGRIFEHLGYGVIRFSPRGEIKAVSPSMLTRLGLDDVPSSVTRLTETIPLGFFNDIVWGLAVAGGHGAFENYRIRMRSPARHDASILFNVSGFRDGDGTIHSLWQVVSQEEGGARLSEGSMLSEVRVHNITRNYVPQLVEEKARHAVRLGKTSLSNEDRSVAVLFCDIVGFTSYVERHAGSESVIDTLNSILRRVSVSVRRHHGAIDKFMGDCIMALFDEPIDAVRAAVDMQSHAEDINSLRSRAGQQTLQLRIGIHYGEVVIGNVGTSERLDWTAIGDVVNTASRIEKGCRPGEILVSAAARLAAEASSPGEFEFGPVFGLQVKGKRDDLAVCYAAAAAG